MKSENVTIHRIHKAEKELHRVHRLCLEAETLYREAQDIPSLDLSFFVPVDISKEIKSKKRIVISEEYLPPCEYTLMCILQKEAQESHRSFDMPMWNNYDEEIVKKMKEELIPSHNGFYSSSSLKTHTTQEIDKYDY